MTANGFSPIENQILSTLSDGMPHHKNELVDLLDPLTNPRALTVYVFRLNKKLERKGHKVVCVIRNRSPWYQHIRLLNTDD